MDVTRYNFTEVLTELEKVLKNASFISIDTEFTGLNAGERTNSLDTPAEYYKKIKTGALDFLLVQFGLAVFNYDEETKNYTHRAYNFYVFPRPSMKNAPDSRFLSQASSLDFLVKNNFNFNKLFLEGIPYLNQKDEQMMRERLEERRKERKSLNTSPCSEASSIPIPEEHKLAITTACEKIANFLQDKTTDESALDSCNAFVRKLIYQEAWKKFSRDELILETKQGQIIAKRTGTPEERERQARERYEKEDLEINEAVGFTQLIKMLSNAGKLIVGHNMLLDLCHILHRFCMPLPDDYQDFKDMLHCLFPKILDTKYLCSNPDIREKVPSSVLSHILQSVAEPPFELVTVEPEDKGCGYSRQDNKAHEAGYDAYITGLVFITLANYLGSVQTPATTPVLPTSPLLKKFINKIFLMKMADTHMNLDGSDPEMKRDHVFHVTFPRQWTTQDINQLFQPYGNVFITWLTDTTAFVTLYNKEQTLNVTRNLVRNKRRMLAGVTVLTYQSYLQQNSNHNDVFSIQSPSIRVAKKRKVSDVETEREESPKRSRRSSRASSSKRSIESIPEEVEGVGDIPVSNSSARSPRNKNGSTAAQNRSRDRFIEENEDWN